MSDTESDAKALRILEHLGQYPRNRRTARIADLCGGNLDLETKVRALLEHLERVEDQGFLSRALEPEPTDVGEEEPDLSGRQIGPYTFQHCLGLGGMGRVYLARDTRLQRLVAIKVLRWNLGAAARERLKREARTLALLNHANICAIYGVERVEGRDLLVMEYIEGTTLVGFRQQERSLAEKLLVAHQIAQGLGYAHQRNIIHRDIKPENILLDAQHQAKLVDFGIALVQAQEEAPATEPNAGIPPGGIRETRAGWVRGTPAYMSPEQSRGEALTPASDMYAFGLVLGELFGIQEVMSLLERKKGVPSSAEQDFHLTVGLRTGGSDRMLKQLIGDLVNPDAQRRPTADQACSVLASVLDAPSRISRKRLRWLTGTLTLILLILLPFMVGNQREKTAILREKEQRLSAAEGHLAEIDGLQRAHEFKQAVTMAERFLPRFGPDLAVLAKDTQFQRERPRLFDQVEDVLGRGSTVRERCVRAWADHERSALQQDPATASPQNMERIEQAFMAFLPFVNEPFADEIPLADQAYWLERAYLAQNTPDKAAEWACRAYLAQPDALAAGSAFQLLAERALKQEDFEQAAIQFHLALSAFGDRLPETRPGLLRGLVMGLANLGSEAPTPYSPQVRAREMALRCLLRIAGPKGDLRSEIAAVLDEEQQPEWASWASAWLTVLRNTVSPVAAPGEPNPQFTYPIDSDRDGASDLVRMTSAAIPADELVMVRFVQPAKPGLDQAQVKIAMRRNLAPMIAAHWPEMAAQKHHLEGPWQMSDSPADGNLLFTLRPTNTAGQLILFGLADWQSEEPWFSCSFPVGNMRPHALASGDLDGDGLGDLALGLGWPHRQAYLLFQRPEGGFESRPLWDSSGQAGVPISDPDALLIDDLDGDGRNELLITRGLWHQFSLDVLQVDGTRTLTTRAQIPAGVVYRLAPLRLGSERLLALSSGTQSYQGMVYRFQARHGPMNPLGLSLLRWNGSELQNVASRPRQAILGGELSFDLCLNPHNLPLVLWELEGRKNFVRGTSSRIQNFHFLRQSESGIELTRTLSVHDPQTGHLFISQAVPAGYFGSGASVYRHLSDADLERLPEDLALIPQVTQGLPLPIAQAQFFQSFGLHRAALDLAERWLSQEKEPLGATAMEAIRLEAAARIMGNTALLEHLCHLRPDPGLASSFLQAAEDWAFQNGRYAEIASLLARWGQDPKLPGLVRKRLNKAAWQWSELASKLDPLAVDWQGRRIDFLNGVRDMADALLQNEPGSMLIVEPQGKEEAITLVGPFREIPTAIASKEREYSPAKPFSGIPLRLGAHSFRLRIEFSLQHFPNWSGVMLGVFNPESVSGGPRPEPVLWLNCGGGGFANYIQAVPTSLNLDGWVGKRLTFQLDYLEPWRKIIYRVFDESASPLVYCEQETTQTLGDWVILGFQGGLYGHPCELTVHRMQMWGEATPIQPDDPAFLTRFSDPDLLHETSRAASLRLTDQWALAARCYERVEKRVRENIDIGGISGGQSWPWNAFANRFQFEGVACRVQLGQPMDQILQDQLAGGLESEWTQWLVEQRPTRADLRLWVVLGRALAVQRFGSDDPAAILARNEEWPEMPRLSRAVLCSYLAQNLPRSEEAYFMALQSCFYPDDYSLDGRFLEVSMRLPLDARQRDWTRSHRAWVLARSQRREEAIALYEEGAPEHEPGFHNYVKALQEQFQKNQLFNRPSLHP